MAPKLVGLVGVPALLLSAAAILVLSAGVACAAFGDGDWTQLRQAVREGDVKQVAALLDSGIDINHQDEVCWTVLHWWNFSFDFSKEKFLGMLRLLVKRGVDVNALDSRGRTALMLLLVPGDDQPRTPQLAAIRILIDAGADLHIKNEWGESALSLGLASEFKSVRAYFAKLQQASPRGTR